MRDTETGSLWSHILGKAMRGEHQGKTLKIIPSVMTTWEDWLKQNPKTKVLNMKRTARGFNKEMYAKPERFLLGLAMEGRSQAYTFDQLLAQPVIEDQFGKLPLVVIYDKKSSFSAMFSRKLPLEKKNSKRKPRELSFKPELKDGFLVDKTGTQWNPKSGLAVSGPLKGKRLEMLPAIISFTKAWRNFHPKSSYWKKARIPDSK